MPPSPTLNIPQARFLTMPQKFRAFVAGYGSGKTFVGSAAMCSRMWRYPKVNQGYFAPTYPQIRDIFYPTIEEVAHSWGLRVDIKTSDKEVHFYSGRQYRGTTICRSMENPGSIIGFKIGHSLVDEFDTLDMQKADRAWKKVIARMRWPNATNGIDVTTTPEGFRATHKLFVADVAESPARGASYGLIQASTRENAANLPDGYIESMYEAYPSELRDAYIDGKFCNLTTGTIYRHYDRVRNRSTEVIREGNSDKPGEPLFIGMDFNVGKMAATIYVQRTNGWHAAAELHDIFDTPDMARIISERWKKHRITVYPDASGGNRHSSGAGTADFAVLQQAGFAIRVNSTNPLVRDRILAVNRKFERAELWVNDKACPTVAKNLEQQAYDANGEPDKKSGFDHQNDATGYPIAYEFPIVRPMARVLIGGR